jgi:hypothetical protein
MVEEDRKEFAVVIGAVAETLGRELTDAMLLGYWFALKDLELKDIQQGCYRALKESSTMPKPAELRELAGVASPDTQANLAWQDVLRATSQGSYRHIDFDDRIINATIRTLGGWPNFLARFTSAREEEFARHAFSKTYKCYLNSGVNGEACLPLAGLSDAAVIDGVVTTPRPVRIESSSGNRPKQIAPPVGRELVAATAAFQEI